MGGCPQQYPEQHRMPEHGAHMGWHFGRREQHKRGGYREHRYLAPPAWHCVQRFEGRTGKPPCDEDQTCQRDERKQAAVGSRAETGDQRGLIPAERHRTARVRLSDSCDSGRCQFR